MQPFVRLCLFAALTLTPVHVLLLESAKPDRSRTVPLPFAMAATSVIAAAPMRLPRLAPPHPPVAVEPVAPIGTPEPHSPERANEPAKPAWVQLAQASAAVFSPLPAMPRPSRRVYPVYSEGIYVVGRRGGALVYLKGIVASAPVHVIQADLRDPEVKVGIAVARAGIGRSEGFVSMLNRTTPAAAITGTFFGLRNGLPTGDIVVNGRAIYRGFIGTALAITDGNVVSFIPCGYNEDTHWEMFDTVIRGGPRLVLGGQIGVNPREEGFRTLAGNAYRSRTAVGITRDRKLLLVAVRKGITLRRLAMVMRALGAYHAVALDGGTSTAMSFGGRVIAQPGRSLTNLLVVYADRDHYDRARKHFYYRAQRRVLPSEPPGWTPGPPPAAGESARPAVVDPPTDGTAPPNAGTAVPVPAAEHLTPAAASGVPAEPVTPVPAPERREPAPVPGGDTPPASPPAGGGS